jgi:hypothetical protein
LILAELVVRGLTVVVHCECVVVIQSKSEMAQVRKKGDFTMMKLEVDDEAWVMRVQGGECQGVVGGMMVGSRGEGRQPKQPR